MVRTMHKYLFSQPPPPSSRPPVTGYKVSHNITGVFTEEHTSDTTLSFESLSYGYYFFFLWAVNTLGEGAKDAKIAGWFCMHGIIIFLHFNKFANNARLFMTSLFMTFQRFINSPEIPKSIT